MTTNNTDIAGGEQSPSVISEKPAKLQSEYYRRNRDEINRKLREKLANDPKYAEEKRAYMRQWHRDNKGKRSEYFKRYRQENYKSKPRVLDSIVNTVQRAYQVSELQKMLPAQLVIAVNRITSGRACLIGLRRHSGQVTEEDRSTKREYASIFRTKPAKVRKG